MKIKREKIQKDKDIYKPIEKLEKIKIPKKRKSLNIFKVDGKFKFIPLMINILIPLLAGSLVGYINKGSTLGYDKLIKPMFIPPSFAFKIVWIVLYILMGIAAYRIFMKNKLGAKDNGAYFNYIIQLIVNLVWPFIFFTFRLYGVSLVVVIILIILVIITAYKFYKIDKMAGYLMIHYIIWIAFASILNFFIYMLNEM